jgi:hypothetical protein
MLDTIIVVALVVVAILWLLGVWIPTVSMNVVLVLGAVALVLIILRLAVGSGPFVWPWKRG